MIELFDKSKFKELGEEIYVYKNFIPEDDCKVILKEANALRENIWTEFAPYGRSISSLDLKSLIPVQKKMELLINDNYKISDKTKIQRIEYGGYANSHTDNGQFKEVMAARDKYKEGSPFSLKEYSHYGTVFYFNEFDGGELFYPNQDIEYHPNPGDLVIHSSFEIARHGIKKVLSEVRYSYANFISELVRVPFGYFK